MAYHPPTPSGASRDTEDGRAARNHPSLRHFIIVGAGLSAGKPPKVLAMGDVMSRVNAHAVLRGPCHVIEEVSPELVALAGRPMRGIPLAEAFPEEQYQSVIDLCDWVAMTRRMVKVAYPASDGSKGVLTIQPTDGGLRAEWSGQLVFVPPPEPYDEVGLAVAARLAGTAA